MKLKTLGGFIILVFCLSFIVFSFCRQGEVTQKDDERSIEWNIPPSILARYTEQDIEDTKGRLEAKFDELKRDIEQNYSEKEYDVIGEILSAHFTTFDEGGTTHQGKDEIAEFFKGHGKQNHPLQMGEGRVKIQCFDIQRPGVTGSGLDFIAVINFNAKFGNGPEEQDPPGDTIYFHRKVCTWY